MRGWDTCSLCPSKIWLKSTRKACTCCDLWGYEFQPGCVFETVRTWRFGQKDVKKFTFTRFKLWYRAFKIGLWISRRSLSVCFYTANLESTCFARVFAPPFVCLWISRSVPTGPDHNKVTNKIQKKPKNLFCQTFLQNFELWKFWRLPVATTSRAMQITNPFIKDFMPIKSLSLCTVAYEIKWFSLEFQSVSWLDKVCDLSINLGNWPIPSVFFSATN